MFMKAIVYTKYGPPEVLKLTEAAKPTPKENEVLIKVRATTVNRTDCGFRKPEPFIVRFFSGLLRPKRTILGNELAGEIEAVGSRVTSFKKGDHVFGLTGIHFGAHAEYVCLPEHGAIAIKPVTMIFEEAAAVCDGALLALTFLRKVNVQSGQKVLIYGASGSIGTAAVQLAKYYGAEVTAVCAQSVPIVKSLGADSVIDCTQDDFTKNGQTYDVIFDAVGKHSFFRCKNSLKRSGVYCGTDLGFLLQNPILALSTAKIGSKKVMFPIPKVNKQDVLFIKEIIEAGKYRAVIDRRYPLEQIVEATRYVETGQKTGNVVIVMQGAI
jgi:NADPH:quinone reductase-like Zn-dependent oxidoreductase